MIARSGKNLTGKGLSGRRSIAQSPLCEVLGFFHRFDI
jgi:hypothetical protein